MTAGDSGSYTGLHAPQPARRRDVQPSERHLICKTVGLGTRQHSPSKHSEVAGVSEHYAHPRPVRANHIGLAHRHWGGGGWGEGKQLGYQTRRVSDKQLNCKLMTFLVRKFAHMS